MWTFHFCNWGALSLSPVIPSLPPSPSLSVKCSAQLFVSSCLFVCVYPSPTPHPATSPSAFSSCKLCFSSCFFHCWASLLLIKVKKEKGAADPTLALSQLQLTETPFHFSPPPLLFSSSSSFHSSLFRPHGSVKTSLPVFVELSSKSILNWYDFLLFYDHYKANLSFGVLILQAAARPKHRALPRSKTSQPSS